MFKKLLFLTLLAFSSSIQLAAQSDSMAHKTSGNPLFPGWYADPEGAYLNNSYWIFPTFSARYEKQVFFDAFSSNDLTHWKKHPHVLDTSRIKWAKQALWAPAIIENNGRFFLFFSANDLQKPGGPYWNPNDSVNHTGGIGVAVSDRPEGPYTDFLGKPLIGAFYNDAQPIDQFVYKDTDGRFYMYYGGWGHCNVVQLKPDFTGFIPWQDGSTFKEITPNGYVEGPFLFKRKDTYYFMWSEGSWGDKTYKVAYAMSKSAVGPFDKKGTILQLDENIATGAGHNSVVNTPNSDNWYIVYHRRPIPNEDRDHRVTCMDQLYFNEDGTIQHVKMTFEGVAPLR